MSTSLITGTFDYDRIDAMDDITQKEELKMILKALKKKEGPDGSPLPTVASTINKDDFQGMFKVKSAETSWGLSGFLGECKVYREEEATEITIKRQEASKGTRLLGVQAAADANFRDEYKYRLDQSRKLAGRLKIAPGDHQDAWMIYFCRYKPAIGYCLPITTFTDTECDTKQSPFYQALLPKLGFN